MSPRKSDSRRRCPICGKPRVEEFKAFCSKACADIDLSRWLSGRYAIPAQENDETDSGQEGDSSDMT